MISRTIPHHTEEKHVHHPDQAHRTSLPLIVPTNISLNIIGQIFDSNMAQKSSKPKQAAESCSGTYKDTIAA